ncbi:MAG TPA: hypothetical protein VFO10_21855 [Oligoflexus sp.]|uniref:hypothetical protein n=1 Tax=Oligoflexus sp. TaxID=1971216 RepID=UPI002D80890E|nr:hypothetical protein [Oligoflexus sp.]HET9239921.1 hypothetical protein [Oligoflexus sp.]
MSEEESLKIDKCEMIHATAWNYLIIRDSDIRQLVIRGIPSGAFPLKIETDRDFYEGLSALWEPMRWDSAAFTKILRFRIPILAEIVPQQIYKTTRFKLGD